ncbi:Cyclic pyranopterin phosphate synthase (MoaA) [hydrothermal vent metagenome]|uniref:GTP 3',8-cyclase n=1 Tax=hydrothermal vent metagenome TaxID=652676 RepID=A0A3B1C8J1_9ZZZZ
MNLIDNYNRKHDYLRISLTDKCNFNCIYCNPKNHTFKDMQKIYLLTFEEIERIVKLFAGKLGFRKVRFTGGEPLVRKDVFNLFERISHIQKDYGLKLGVTTNGSLVKNKTDLLKKYGFHNLNISLDTLDRVKFKKITGKDDLGKVMRVIDEAEVNGFNPVKVNVVVIKGINDDEILEFVDYFKDRNVNIRFIEFMPFGSNDWQRNGFISYGKIKELVKRKVKLIPLIKEKNGVAKDFQIVGHPGKVSFITSISEHFCSTCNRVRISSDGKFRVCLFSQGESYVNFKEMFRNGLSDEEIITKLNQAIKTKWEKHPEPEELANAINNNMMAIGG